MTGETFLHGCGGDPDCDACHPETPPLFRAGPRPLCGAPECRRCYPAAEVASQIERDFLRFDRDNPEVWDLFVRFAFEARRAGHARFSSDAVVHRIRWENSVRPRGTQPGPPADSVKMSNNWTPYYARKFLRAFAGKVPADFFTLRPVGARR